jgi:hypothetical protein
VAERAAVDVLVESLTGSRSRLTIGVDFTGHGIAPRPVDVGSDDEVGEHDSLRGRWEVGHG